MSIAGIGHADGTISILSTGNDSPLVTMEQATDSPVIDIAWSSDGCLMIGLAYDSTLIFAYSEHWPSVNKQLDGTAFTTFIKVLGGSIYIYIYRRHMGVW